MTLLGHQLFLIYKIYCGEIWCKGDSSHSCTELMSEAYVSETLSSTSGSIPHLELVVSYVPIQEYINEKLLFLPDVKLYVIHLNTFGFQFYTLNMSHTYPHTVREKASWLQSNHLGSRRNSWLSPICFAFKWIRNTWPIYLDTCRLLQCKKYRRQKVSQN